MKQKQNDWASSAQQSKCISRRGKHGDQAAMRAEPFHQQWFVLITHENTKLSKCCEVIPKFVYLCWKQPLKIENIQQYLQMKLPQLKMVSNEHRLSQFLRIVSNNAIRDNELPKSGFLCTDKSVPLFK